MNTEEIETNRLTIVIFGISGFVGSNLAEFLKKDFRVVGTYYKYKVQIPGVLTIPCDVLSKEEVQMALYSLKPDIAIYCAGYSSVVDCSETPEVADALNTAGLINVTEYCQRYKAQICYISSSFVFGGEDKDYVEMDIPDSGTVYGKTVASSEFYIQKTSLNYVIFRCCRLYGRGIHPYKLHWFELMQKQLMLGKNIALDDNIVTGFLDIYYLGLLLKLSFKTKVTNRLFQVCSRDFNTFYGFGQEYAKAFSTNESMFSKGRFAFPRVGNSARALGDGLYFKMDTSNIEGYLNVKLPSIQESLEFTFKRFLGEKKTDRGGSDITFI